MADRHGERFVSVPSFELDHRNLVGNGGRELDDGARVLARLEPRSALVGELMLLFRRDWGTRTCLRRDDHDARGVPRSFWASNPVDAFRLCDWSCGLIGICSLLFSHREELASGAGHRPPTSGRVGELYDGSKPALHCHPQPPEDSLPWRAGIRARRVGAQPVGSTWGVSFAGAVCLCGRCLHPVVAHGFARIAKSRGGCRRRACVFYRHRRGAVRARHDGGTADAVHLKPYPSSVLFWR